MDDLERGLRDLLTDDRLDVHVRPDAARLVHDGIRRRRRNRAVLLAGSTAVVTVLAIGGAVIASGPGAFDTIQPGDDEQPTTAPASGKPTPPSTAITSSHIGWAPIAYDASKTFALPGTTPDPAVPWCDPKNLSVSPSEFQGATGNAAGSVTVTNGGEPCAVQGTPQVTGYAGDEVVALPAEADSFVVHPWIAL
jgi:hypothetical protein